MPELKQFKPLEEIAGAFGAEYHYGAVMAPYTTFKIGGPADFLVFPNSEQCLIALATKARELGVAVRIIGRGSNVLVSDKGIRGLVLIPRYSSIEIDITDNRAVCSAGSRLSEVCTALRDAGLSGLEFAFGIPGSVGGAVFMNAGAYSGEMKQVVESVRYLGEDELVHILKKDELDFSYRHSAFSGTKRLILSAELKLVPGETYTISEHMNDFLSRRKDKQPLDFPSAGSTFKRPEGFFAAKLIDDCGLKGFTIGGAAVSEKHAGFVINKGGATFADVMSVIEGVQRRVFEQTGVLLEREVEILE